MGDNLWDGCVNENGKFDPPRAVSGGRMRRTFKSPYIKGKPTAVMQILSMIMLHGEMAKKAIILTLGASHECVLEGHSSALFSDLSARGILRYNTKSRKWGIGDNIGVYLHYVREYING